MKTPIIYSHHHQKPTDNDLVFMFDQDRIFLTPEFEVPSWKIIKNDLHTLDKKSLYCFANTNNKNCFIVSTTTKNNFTHVASHPVKNSWQTKLSDIIGTLAIRAHHLNHWQQTHQYCGTCGQTLIDMTSEIGRQCQHCHTIVYPRISPCVMVLIIRDNKLLLARSAHFSKGVHSALAGFIEPGETAEDAIHREVQEEVGLKIKNIRYFGSQPWPFPDSLMLGFYADYATGEINIDHHEIETADWFSMDNLPQLPNHKTLARRLIETQRALLSNIL